MLEFKWVGLNSIKKTSRKEIQCQEVKLINLTIKQKKLKTIFINLCEGLILMLVSGLHISYGIFNIDFTTTYNQSIIKSSWYFGVIIAGLATHFLTDKWEKKFFYVSCVF